MEKIKPIQKAVKSMLNELLAEKTSMHKGSIRFIVDNNERGRATLRKSPHLKDVLFDAIKQIKAQAFSDIEDICEQIKSNADESLQA